MALELCIFFATLPLALALRPWRLLAGGALLSPLLGSLVILPWLWALPRLHTTMPLPLQLSGACAVTLMFGWPLAVPVLTAVALLSGLLAPAAKAARLVAPQFQCTGSAEKRVPAGFDHRGGVALGDDRRAFDGGPGCQRLAHEQARLPPLAGVHGHGGVGGRPVRPNDVDLRWVGAMLFKNGVIEESGLGAAVLNLVLAMNHRKDRYIAS